MSLSYALPLLLLFARPSPLHGLTNRLWTAEPIPKRRHDRRIPPAWDHRFRHTVPVAKG